MSCMSLAFKQELPYTQTCSNIPGKKIALVAARPICHGLQECNEPTVVTNLLNDDASNTFTESCGNFAEAVVTTDVNYLP